MLRPWQERREPAGTTDRRDDRREDSEVDRWFGRPGSERQDRPDDRAEHEEAGF
jgi:hypothetical protein